MTCSMQNLAKRGFFVLFCCGFFASAFAESEAAQKTAIDFDCVTRANVVEDNSGGVSLSYDLNSSPKFSLPYGRFYAHPAFDRFNGSQNESGYAFVNIAYDNKDSVAYRGRSEYDGQPFTVRIRYAPLTKFNNAEEKINPRYGVRICLLGTVPKSYTATNKKVSRDVEIERKVLDVQDGMVLTLPPNNPNFQNCFSTYKSNVAVLSSPIAAKPPMHPNGAWVRDKYNDVVFWFDEDHALAAIDVNGTSSVLPGEFSSAVKKKLLRAFCEGWEFIGFDIGRNEPNLKDVAGFRVHITNFEIKKVSMDDLAKKVSFMSYAPKETIHHKDDDDSSNSTPPQKQKKKR